MKNNLNSPLEERYTMTECVSFMNLTMILSLALFFMSLFLPLLHVMFASRAMTMHSIIEMLIKYALFFNVGCLFVVGAAGQFLYGPEIASCIGWSWSPFQYELAFSELTLGVLGLMAPVFYREFWLSTIIATVIWLLGASGVHLYYFLVLGNTTILNASFVIVWNILLALWLAGLYTTLSKPLLKLFRAFDAWQESKLSL